MRVFVDIALSFLTFFGPLMAAFAILLLCLWWKLEPPRLRPPHLAWRWTALVVLALYALTSPVALLEYRRYLFLPFTQIQVGDDAETAREIIGEPWRIFDSGEALVRTGKSLGYRCRESQRALPSRYGSPVRVDQRVFGPDGLPKPQGVVWQYPHAHFAALVYLNASHRVERVLICSN